MKKRWVWILVISVLLLLGIAALFLFLRQRAFLINAFPEGEDVRVDFPDASWLFSPVRGIIKSYEETPEGVIYLNLQYYWAGKPALVKVLLAIPETSSVYESSNVGIYNRTRLRRSYFKYVQVIAASGETEKKMTTIDEFKRIYPKNTPIKVLVVKEYPEIGLRTDDFCQSRDFYLCVIADSADFFGGDLVAFWRQDGSPYDGFLIPYYFSFEIKPNE